MTSFIIQQIKELLWPKSELFKVGRDVIRFIIKAAIKGDIISWVTGSFLEEHN